MNENSEYITVDFYSDLWSDIIDIIKNRCIQNNIKIRNLDDRDLFVKYADLVQKNITPAKRKVHYPTKDFKKYIKPYLKKGFASFIQACQEGKTLTKYQSLKVNNFFNDKMFQHWSIHHFHLSNLLHSSNAAFNSRTKELLFAIVLPEDLYILFIGDHADFTNQKAMKIIEQSYQEIAEHFPSLDIEIDPLSDQDIHMLRKKNVNALSFPKIGNKSILLGSGIMSNGASILNRIKCDYYRYEIKHYDENWFKCDLFLPDIQKYLINFIETADKNKKYHIVFTLKVNEDFNLQSIINNDLGENFIYQTHVEYQINGR